MAKREVMERCVVVVGGIRCCLCTPGTILNHISYKHLLAERSPEQLCASNSCWANTNPPTPRGDTNVLTSNNLPILLCFLQLWVVQGAVGPWLWPYRQTGLWALRVVPPQLLPSSLSSADSRSNESRHLSQNTQLKTSISTNQQGVRFTSCDKLKTFSSLLDLSHCGVDSVCCYDRPGEAPWALTLCF